MSQMILNWSDIFIISFFLDNFHIGQYTLITKIGSFILFPASAVFIFFSNITVKAIQEKEISKLKIYVRNGTFILLCISFSMILFLNLYHYNILSFFGKDFLVDYKIILVYTIGQGVFCCFGMYESIFLMTQLKKYYILFNIGAVLLNFIIGIPLVHCFGILGAAYSSLISILLMKFAQIYILKKIKWEKLEVS